MNLKQYLETGTVVTLRDNSQFLIMNDMVNVTGQKENVGIFFLLQKNNTNTFI